MNKILRSLPGILLCFGVMLVGSVLAGLIGQEINKLQGLPAHSSSPISAIFMAIILGLLVRNILGLQETFRAGVAFSIKFILRFGIILLGIRLSFYDVVKLGAWGLPIILTCVISGLVLTLWITTKMRQSYRLGTLIAVGTGICGVTAIVGTAPSIKANDEEMAYAIANITLFGIIAMFAYPYLSHYLFPHDAIKTGLFLGTAIHETAQVAGAALIYDQLFDMSRVVDVATITKLTRNSLLILVVPFISYYYLKKMATHDEQENSVRPKWYTLIPLFVLGFIGMAIIRTIGDAGVTNHGAAFGLLNSTQWVSFWKGVNELSATMLGIAMAGVGLSTNFKVFRGLGIKPFFIGLVAMSIVSLISLIMISLLGDFIMF